MLGFNSYRFVLYGFSEIEIYCDSQVDVVVVVLICRSVSWELFRENRPKTCLQPNKSNNTAERKFITVEEREAPTRNECAKPKSNEYWEKISRPNEKLCCFGGPHRTTKSYTKAKVFNTTGISVYIWLYLSVFDLFYECKSRNNK